MIPPPKSRKYKCLLPFRWKSFTMEIKYREFINKLISENSSSLINSFVPNKFYKPNNNSQKIFLLSEMIKENYYRVQYRDTTHFLSHSKIVDLFSFSMPLIIFKTTATVIFRRKVAMLFSISNFSKIGTNFCHFMMKTSNFSKLHEKRL